MPNTPVLTAADAAAAGFAKKISRVVATLESRVVGILDDSRKNKKKKLTDEERYDIAALLSARPQMLGALKEAGYYDLANAHVANYAGIVDKTRDAFKRHKLPAPKFTEADKAVFRQLAQVDLERFAAIGEAAINELHYGLVKQALIRAPFTDMVATVRLATIGKDRRGGPLQRYSYTHANTAVLNFGGESIRIAGEGIGAKLWECVGPLDDVTRPECQDALAAGAQTAEEWQSQGYWGGTPGGWNCRHQLFPAEG